MSEQRKRSEDKTPGMFRQPRIWWLLSLAVLLLLLGVVYLLAHLSSSDTEMYPTTQLGSWTILTFC